MATPAVTVPSGFVSLKTVLPSQFALLHSRNVTVPVAFAVSPLTVATSWIVPAGSRASVADVGCSEWPG